MVEYEGLEYVGEGFYFQEIDQSLQVALGQIAKTEWECDLTFVQILPTAMGLNVALFREKRDWS